MSRKVSHNKFFPVIHTVNRVQALRNADIAFENGADGIFLVNHTVPSGVLKEAYRSLRFVLGGEKFIGVNFLDLSPLEAAKSALELGGLSAIWMDSVGYQEEVDDPITSVHVPMRVRDLLIHGGFAGLWFGGIAFKGQKEVIDLHHSSQTLTSFVDVLTTSGPRTGEPPTVEKVLTIREASPALVAIASGIDKDNVGLFLKESDYFLVATSISRSFTELDPKKVKLLAKEIHKEPK